MSKFWKSITSLFLVFIMLATSIGQDAAYCYAQNDVTDYDLLPATYQDMEDVAEESMYAVLGLPSVARSSCDDQALRVLAAPIPLSYNSIELGYVPPVRNQGRWGCCWAFSAIDAAEIYMIKNGGAANTINLSERQLVYCIYNYEGHDDPLNNTLNDYAKTQSNKQIYEVGGNINVTTWMLANWMGPIKEEDAPYNASGSMASLTDDAYFNQNELHMTGMKFLSKEQPEVIKKEIMDKGCVGCSYYTGSSYYNSANYAQYCPSSIGVNHAVAIVGWDDSFPASKFKTSPGRDGAWLVRNSYGEGSGDRGYFWLSYEDKTYKDIFSMTFETANDYDNNYFIDGMGGNKSVSTSNGNTICNVFTARHETEILKAVGVGIKSADVSYSVQIYKNPTDVTNPSSGEAMLATPVVGTTDCGGYYTIPLGTEIELKKDDVFAVAITLTVSGGSVSLFVEKNQTESWISIHSEILSGTSFVGNGRIWSDMVSVGSEPMAFRIHAYTDEKQSDGPEIKPGNKPSIPKPVNDSDPTIIEKNCDESGVVTNEDDTSDENEATISKVPSLVTDPNEKMNPVWKVTDGNAHKSELLADAEEEDKKEMVGTAFYGVGIAKSLLDKMD